MSPKQLFNCYMLSADWGGREGNEMNEQKTHESPDRTQMDLHTQPAWMSIFAKKVTQHEASQLVKTRSPKDLCGSSATWTGCANMVFHHHSGAAPIVERPPKPPHPSFFEHIALLGVF